MSAFDRLTQLLDLFRLPERTVRKTRRQVAAVVVRDGSSGPEILLVTSRERGRWIVPKGWIEGDEDGAEAAMREAWEEAGIRGRLASSGPIGSYRYTKQRHRRGDLACNVDVYLIDEVREQDKWPEMRERRRQWMALPAALELLSEPELKELLAGLAIDVSAT